MSKKKVQKYCGRAVTWRTVAGQMRYSAEKRTALDGKVWWCIFDHKECKYIAGYKCRTRTECEGLIGGMVRAGELPTDKSDFLEYPNGFKKGKHKFAVDVHWDVARSYEVEAESADENKGEKIGEVTRYAVTFVEYGESVDGKARTLGLYATHEEAHYEMSNAAERYLNDLGLDSIKMFQDSASVGSTDECGCEYGIEKVTIPIYKGEIA